jgi:hypothetical protein
MRGCVSYYPLCAFTAYTETIFMYSLQWRLMDCDKYSVISYGRYNWYVYQGQWSMQKAMQAFETCALRNEVHLYTAGRTSGSRPCTSNLINYWNYLLTKAGTPGKDLWQSYTETLSVDKKCTLAAELTTTLRQNFRNTIGMNSFMYKTSTSKPIESNCQSVGRRDVCISRSR